MQLMPISYSDENQETPSSNPLGRKRSTIRWINNLNVFYKDLIKDPEVSALLMIVDDNARNAGKKREAVLNREYKYIGISSRFYKKSFVAFLSFSK